MKTRAYKPESFDSEKGLVELLDSLYGSYGNFTFFLEEYERAYNFCCTSEHIQFYPLAFCDGDKLIAHVALILDDRLQKHEAFFGFFEVVDDIGVFDVVWRELTQLAKKNDMLILKGPVNGSIWHQYRCVQEDSIVPYFKTEPMTPLYYHDFLSSVKPVDEVTYSSGIRNSYSEILDVLGKHKDIITRKLADGDFEIKIAKEVSSERLHSIAGVSTTVFNEKSWGYTQLDRDEFLSLYDPSKINEHVYKLFLLYHNEVLIGYCSTMKEEDSLICKTICIVEEYQGKGLGNALALAVHEEAKRDGIKRIMYVLVKDGNQVHNYPTEDVEIFRKYSVFEYKISK